MSMEHTRTGGLADKLARMRRDSNGQGGLGGVIPLGAQASGTSPVTVPPQSLGPSSFTTDKAALPIKLSLTFTPVSQTSISWSSGTIFMADSSTQSVSSGTYSSLSSAATPYYLYCDLDDATPSTLKVTTNFSTAATGRHIIIAILVQGTDSATKAAAIPAGNTSAFPVILASMIVCSQLSAIVADLGLVTAGEFRLGNGNNPGSGFTGIRIYKSGTTYQVQGVNNDVIQAQFDSDGKLKGGAGAVVIDENGLTIDGQYLMLNYLGVLQGVLYGVTDAVGLTAVKQLGLSSGDTYPITCSGKAFRPPLHTSAPASPSEGDTYWDSTTHAEYQWNGSAWVTMQPGSSVPSGNIMAWAGNISAIPSGWHLCDGSAISRTTYAALFAAYGTKYGIGDGSTTFNIPDYRSDFLRGAPAGFDPGGTSGSATHTHNNHTVTQPNAHSFTQSSAHGADVTGSTSPTTDSQGGHTHNSHTNGSYGGGPDGSYTFTGPITHSTDGSHSHGGLTHSHSTPSLSHSGGAVDAHAGTAVDSHSNASNMPPYVDVTWIIKL